MILFSLYFVVRLFSFLACISGTAKLASATNNIIKLAGLVKNTVQPPIMTARIKLVSAIFPSTIPRTIGATG